MSSPIPPDPYAALGVAKESDISAIRTAHRKLVLKHHPDRIKDPALKERGKDEFQKIQQAYELLSDPVRRTRYDDKIKLAELRKEAMMRDPTPRNAYPSRHAPSAAASREWNSDDQTFYEVRQPKESYFDSKEKFEEPSRTSSRKYNEYERPSSSRKASAEAPRTEKSRASAKWGAAFAAVNVGIKIKQETERRKESSRHVKEQELRDREKRKNRQEKEQQTRRPYVVSEDSDSDTATRVTEATIRPSRHSSARHSRDPDPNYSSSHARSRSYTDGESDQESTFSDKWQKHHNKSMDYILKASAAAGNKRPGIIREGSGSYWNGRKNSSDSERRPTSSRGRHEYEESAPPPRPSMPTQNSAPSNLKSRLAEERAPNARDPRRSATGSYPIREKEADHRKEMGGIPSIHRAQTMPTTKSSSKKDAAPPKSSNLKHTETQDSGYGSSSTPEMRGESPSRRPKETKVKYQIVDPVSDDDDRATQVRRVDSDSDHRRRRNRSPDTVIREPRRENAEKIERPKPAPRSKTTREALSDRPKMRHSDSARYDRSPRDATPPLSRNGSGREKLAYELSDSERERERESRYKYSAEKMNVRSAYQDPSYSNYRESPDRRGHDHTPGSRFQENVRHPTSRRPSVY